tara:strand:+ start:50409 stop:51626 length:1218 start_codon:yes stop_codon:yes gene_type:complete
MDTLYSEQMTERRQDIAALVLFLSRETVDPSEYDRARTLCARVSDWEKVSEILTRKFVISVAYSNLLKIQPDNLPREVLDQMKADATLASMASLKMVAAQDKFYRNCLAPLNCRHAFIKGTGLAQRYYHEPGMRMCRDIDVLVSEESIESVVRLALSNGYKVKIKSDLLTSDPSERALKALLSYAQIVTLLSPDSTWFEVHTHIDYGLEMFETERLLASSVALTDQKVGPCVPATAEHFCFVCYHSTRHTWSRLHWLSDINAMLDHSSFQLDEVMSYAKEVGLEPTLNATLEFQRAARSGDWAGNMQGLGPYGKQLLEDCVANLADDFETEMNLRSKFNYLGLPYAWMLDTSARPRAYLNRSRARVRPSYYLYESIPLPRGLQWLYYPMKPIFVFWNRIVLRRNT